jgi:hypothetical protein
MNRIKVVGLLLFFIFTIHANEDYLPISQTTQYGI